MLGANTVLPLGGVEAEGEGAFFTLQDSGAAAEAAIVTAVDRAVLLKFEAPSPNGRAMLIFGGGGYTALMAGREGVQVARWLTGLGYAAYVLIHRFPNEETSPSAPLDDAREAMAAIRVDMPGAAIGVVGLSSGGHLAACLAAGYPEAWQPPCHYQPDAIRPDLLVIGYAPISTNAEGRTVIADKPPLEPFEKQALYDALQPDAQLLQGAPPTFIAYAANDPIVPVANAWRLHSALIAAGGTAELHVFADAPHGFALDTVGLPVSGWPTLCEAWLRQVGFLDA